MKNFDWDALGREEIVVWCKTEEEAKDFCKQSHEYGYDWRGGNSRENNRENVTYWGVYKAQTCYADDGYCDKSWFEKYKYNILEWSDCMDKLTNSESDSKTTFTKSDLKDGDVILRRNGWVEIAIPSVWSLVDRDGHNDFNALTEDLKENNGEPEYDIIEIRRPNMPHHCQFCAFECGFGDLVYKREEEIEMTLEEVCQALGKKIKIIESKAAKKMYEGARVKMIHDYSESEDYKVYYPPVGTMGTVECLNGDIGAWVCWDSGVKLPNGEKISRYYTVKDVEVAE